MSFVDTLTVNILLAKAEKAGADPDRSWPIVIFGPSSPSYRLKAPILGPMIMTLNNDVVTVEGLKELTNISVPITCFYQHTNEAKCHPNIGVYRIIPSDPTAVNGRVGRILSLTWDQELYSLIGVLEAAPEWNDIFLAEWESDDLHLRGFSIHIVGTPVQWRPNKRSLESHDVYESIERTFSIDLVQFPAAGGRFLLPGCEQTYEIIFANELEFDQSAPFCTDWIDDGENTNDRD